MELGIGSLILKASLRGRQLGRIWNNCLARSALPSGGGGCAHSARTAALQGRTTSLMNFDMGFLQKFAHHVNPAAGCQSSSQKPGATPQNRAPNGARIQPKSMKNRARAHLGQQLAAKRGPRAPKMRPRCAQEVAKSAQERPKSAQEPPKRRPGDVQTWQKSAPERSRTSFSCAHGRKPCSRSCWADFCSCFVSRA